MPAINEKVVFDCERGDFNPMVYPCPVELKKELMRAYAEDYMYQPEEGGNLDLREAISEYEREGSDLHYQPDEIVVGCGSRVLLYAIFRTLCGTEGGVICPLPSRSLPELIELVGGSALKIECKAENGFLPRMEDLRPLLNNAVLIPLNATLDPAGTGFTEYALQEICMMVVMENRRRKKGEKKLYLVYDNQYAGLAGKGLPVHDPVIICPEVKQYLVYVNSISKVFAVNGLRVGWAMGDAMVIKQVQTVLASLGGMAPMAEQKAVARFLPQSQAIVPYLRRFRSELYYVQRVIYTSFKQMNKEGLPVDAIEPRPGIFLAVYIGLVGKTYNHLVLEDAKAVAGFLMEEAGVAVLPYSAFGMPGEFGWFRMTVGMLRREDVRVMMLRFREAVGDLLMHRDLVGSTEWVSTKPEGI